MEKKIIIKKEFAHHNVADLFVESYDTDSSIVSESYVEIKIVNNGCTMMSVNGIDTDSFVLKLNGHSEREMLKELCEMILSAI
jgi:hypothetical protein